MAGLTYPYDFTNGTTADGDQVQEQFDAVKDFTDGIGLSADDGIPTSAIKQDNGLAAGHIGSGAVGTSELGTAAVTTPKVAIPTVSSDTGANTDLAQNTWTDTGATLTLSSGCFYIVLATVVFTEAHTGTVGSTGQVAIELQSRLLLGAVTLDSMDNDVVIDANSRPVTHKLHGFADTSLSTTLKIQGQSNGLFTSISGASTVLRAIKIAG